MQKFFGFWLGLMMLIYTVFTPIYLFSNSSTDEVEEITFEKLLVSLSYRGISQSETSYLVQTNQNQIPPNQKSIRLCKY